MPQIYMIVGPEMAEKTREILFSYKLRSMLINVVERGFGISGHNDVAFTGIVAAETQREANVQIEIRYTAGKDEYNQGKPFDPDEETQKEVAGILATELMNFCSRENVGPPLEISVWFKPYYKSFFNIYKT